MCKLPMQKLATQITQYSIILRKQTTILFCGIFVLFSKRYEKRILRTIQILYCLSLIEVGSPSIFSEIIKENN